MHLKQIATEYLKTNGFDGLCNIDIECGCILGDLMPCDDPSAEHCEPGYVCNHPEHQVGWMICTEKPKE